MSGIDIYDSTDIASIYDTSRKLPEETLKQWIETISNHIPENRIATILDVGCGTGRFAEALSSHFSAKVYGLDPSQEMLEVAKNTISAPFIYFLRSTGEEIPLKNETVDMVFVSMVYHHIKDKKTAFAEFNRIMTANAYLCIRTATIECMDSYLWFHYFPTARKIDFKRMPSRENLIGLVSENGFELKLHEVVGQIFSKNHRDYLEKIGLRGISTLRKISDDEFHSGLEELRRYCHTRNNDEAVFEDVDLFIFTPVQTD